MHGERNVNPLAVTSWGAADRAHFLSSAGHASTLTDLASRALRAGDAATAFALADRRCRIARPHEAHDFLLRGEALRRLGDPEGAVADIQRALAIDPTDPLVNFQAMLLLESPSALEAARRLVALPSSGSDQLRAAIDRHVAAGEAIVGRLGLVNGIVSGWVSWPREADLVCRIKTGELERVMSLSPDPRHPLAGDDRSACTCRIARPTDGPVEVRFETGCASHAPLTHSFVLRSGERPPRPTGVAAAARDLTVIVPVYEDEESTHACLDSLARQVIPGVVWRTVVVNDASPNPRIVADLERRAQRSEIELLTHESNQGFAAAVNAAALSSTGDLLLLNADTLLPPGALRRLCAVAASAGTIGTVTPISNNGELTSFPRTNTFNPLPNPADLHAWDKAAATHGGAPVDLPNGIGFCLLIKRACWNATGGLTHAYGRGYYEDVELCLRARDHGFRNVCATTVVVGHAGSRSFRADKRALVVRNLAILEDRYPGYGLECAAFLRADPLRPVWGRIERNLPPPAHAILLVSPWPQDHPSVAKRCAELEANGQRCLIVLDEGRAGIAVRSASGGLPQSLRFGLAADELADLAAYVQRAGIGQIEVMSPHRLSAGLHAAIRGTGLPVRIYLGEASLDLADGTDRAKALHIEGAVVTGPVLCSDRMALAHARRHLPIGYATELAAPAVHGCAAPITPCHPSVLAVLSPVASGAGDGLLAALARLGRRDRSPLQLRVLGSTLEDRQAMATGRVFVSGPLIPDEWARAIRHVAPTAILLPYRTSLFHVLEAVQAITSTRCAFFDWSRASFPVRADDLALNPEICDDDAARMILDWFLDPHRHCDSYAPS